MPQHRLAAVIIMEDEVEAEVAAGAEAAAAETAAAGEADAARSQRTVPPRLNSQQQWQLSLQQPLRLQ